MQPIYDDYTIRLYMTNAELMKVKAQRDKLLAICKALVRFEDGGTDPVIYEDAVSMARAAIADARPEEEIEL